MKNNYSILGSIIFGLLATMVPSAVAQAKSVSLPADAQEIEPGVYYLGRVKDRAGRDVEGIAFVHSKKSQARPGGGGSGPNANSCYSFLGNGARWKTIENFVVSTTIANAADGAFFVAQISSAMDNWEAAAGKPIFGSGTIGAVDSGLIGNAVNGANEVTFGPIANSSTLAITFIWGVFGGQPAGRAITEWDIILRDDVSWSSTGEPNKYDFWNTFAHECGHATGMGHSSDSCTEETMYRFISLGETEKQTLGLGDSTGIAALYK